MQRLFDLLARPSPGYHVAVNISQWLFALAVILLLINPVIGLALGLTLLTALLLFSPRPNPRRQFVLCMIGLGLMLTAIVEIVVLKGDISRMNTVFKFYLQVWVLWAIASVAVLPSLASNLRLKFDHGHLPAIELPEGSAWTPEVAAQVERQNAKPITLAPRIWWSAFAVLLAACFLYPLTATPVRAGDRFKDSRLTTLDGTAYMKTSVYNDEGRPIILDWDRQAIAWLRQNVSGMSTIVEANTPLYRWGSRVSIYTGLPTVIGWDWHQKQQRSVLPGQAIDRRIADVRTIYTSIDPIQTKQLLDQYHVQYIYLGQLERIYYNGKGLDKFDQPGNPWNLVYQNDQVKIYKVN